jgi:eukaryotic-like serine/threonine-protein kinase
MPLSSGTRLGPYEILTPIGAGGMGEVFLASDTRLYRNVAIKVLPRDRVADPERKRRFLQEARAASALNHPNIVTLYDISNASGTDYLVMEYVPGKSLDKLIPASGLPLRDVLSLAQQIASALVAAHAAGIVHRDLKPANVMVMDSGFVKVLDFGLAKRPDRETVKRADGETETITSGADATLEGSILGTANYMSPEQAQGKRVDARSDIFSFGAVLYEMVTGARAFQGETMVDTLAAILRDEVRLEPSEGSDIPPGLEELIRRCLQKKLEDRWQAMSDVQATLATIQNEPASAPVPARAAEPAAQSVRYAGFWIRSAARVIDIIALGIVLSILRYVLPILPLFREGPFVLLVAGIYEVYFVSARAATVGKMVLNLKIVQADGSAVPRRLAAGRYLAMGVSLLIVTIGFLMIAFDKEKRALHDRICGTRVIVEK